MTISRAEYARRRKALMDRIGPDAIAVLPAAPHALRNADSEYPYRQDSDFMYLSGFDEPDAMLVLVPGRRVGKAWMFCRERDPLMETWNGYRLGPEGVLKLGINEARPMGDLDRLLPGLLAGRREIYLSLGRRPGLEKQVTDWIEASRTLPAAVGKPVSGLLDLDPLLHEQRVIKSPAEQRIMRRAARITAAAHKRAMLACRPGQAEYHLEAELLHEFMRGGARFPAYNSIVGAGRNACILHYMENNAIMADGDLVLIDAGCELEHYAADVTRTFPANGRFTDPQKALYEIVLQAQQAAIRQVAPGKRYDAPNKAAIRVITRGLLSLGLLKGDLKDLIRSGSYRQFYMHSTSHWLGMDVHDAGAYRQQGKWRVLEPGMVLTVEPGIYIAADNTKVAKKWRGIGIRIEDDVLVTETGCEILSQGAPKSVEEIETLMAAGEQ